MSISISRFFRSIRAMDDIRSAVGAAKEFKRSANDQDARTGAVAL